MIQALFNQTAIAMRDDLVLECLTNELIRLSPAVVVELVSAPPAADAALPDYEPGAARCYMPGRYRFRINGTMDMHVMCVEQAVLNWIAPQVRLLGHGDSQGVVTDEHVRRVVRSLSNHCEFFNGTVDSLTSQPLRLRDYGG
jgi:hypothetical protein